MPSLALALVGIAVVGIIVGRLYLVLKVQRKERKTFSAGDFVLFVTAHPDDECMFFSPSITAACRVVGHGNVHVLCLSTGDFYGQGAVRQKELVSSCSRLGVQAENVFLVNHESLQDGDNWQAALVADQITQQLAKFSYTKLVTFDAHGVSSHPNHISLYLGVRHMRAKGNLSASTRAYSLDTVNIINKYSSFLGYLLTGNRRMMTIVSSVHDWSSGISAMLEHRSQLLWFRYLFILFSRYMWVNTLSELKEA